MLEELLVLVVVFGTCVLLVDQIRRLIAHVSLNRTLREALKQAPEHVPALLDKVEQRPLFPLALGGWVFLAGAAAIGGLMLVYGEADESELWTVCAGLGLIGVALLAWSRYNARRTSALVDSMD
ncbi:PrgI family protein [Erythrobacter sp. AP23]|uniref:PrgI family protein n=1 Tax=Erythrobacter sp. AP23 TaxID=499656 RepID=UPI00076BF661|nr:PrgI family protein [Erythrobacter sp. AP23]KWV94870.1 hypothetical protein ASS64_06620 [Erythrobacter sp. AP23]